MAVFIKFQPFVEDLAEGVHNLASDELKVVLTNSAPDPTDGLLADITQISNGNGYTTDGTVAVQASSAQTGGTYKLVLSDVVFTATGGSIGPFRWPVLYNNGTVVKVNPLIGHWDYGSSITLAVGETFTVDFDATNGVIQLV
jgi:hypothetical protein